MALLETLHRADTKLQRSLRDIELEPEPEKESKFKSFFGKVAENVSSGASTLATPISTGVGKLQDSFSSTANDVAQFFRWAPIVGLTGDPGCRAGWLLDNCSSPRPPGDRCTGALLASLCGGSGQSCLRYGTAQDAAVRESTLPVLRSRQARRRLLLAKAAF